MTSQPWSLPDELRQLAESGETDLVQEVLSVFRSDTASRLSRLGAGIAAGDREAVKHEAHAVKGSAGQVGAGAVAAICQKIEAQAMTARKSELNEMLARLDAAFAEVCGQMRG